MTLTEATRVAGRWAILACGASLMAGSIAAAHAPGRGTGTIEGRVVYHGEVPAPTIVMEGGRTQHVLYTGEGGGLRYAVAFLPDAAAAPLVEEDPPTLYQSGFVFEPQVLAVREGQAVRFTNDDGANHNVRSDDPPNRFSIYTGAGQVGIRRFAAPPDRRPLTIACDVHPWMIAWIYVLPHPHFAVTDAAGRFRIAGVAAGVHRLSVRQPAGGLRRDVRVRVAAGEVAHVAVSFTASDLRLHEHERHGRAGGADRARPREARRGGHAGRPGHARRPAKFLERFAERVARFAAS